MTNPVVMAPFGIPGPAAAAANGSTTPEPEEVPAAPALTAPEPDASASAGRRASPPSGTSVMMDINCLHPHPDNIRDSIGDVTDMAASVASCGILQPLTVAPHPSKAGHYHIIAGHRRLEAAKLAGLAEVPVIIRRRSIGAASAIQVMLVENCQRADLNPIEKAEAMGKLRDEEGWTSARIAKAIGMTDASIANYLALLELAPASRKDVATGKLSKRDAVQAVRAFRARTARTSGHANRREAAAATWEPDYFVSTHPLARKAQALCDAREHNNRRRIGKIACGQCWETVIRDDERLVASVQPQG